MCVCVSVCVCMCVCGELICQALWVAEHAAMISLTVIINPFTAPACKRFRLTDAGTHPKTVGFPVLQHIYFQCPTFWWKSFHMPERKRRQKSWRVSNLVLSLVVFNWHHGSERVEWRNDQQAAPSTVLFVESNLMLVSVLWQRCFSLASTNAATNLIDILTLTEQFFWTPSLPWRDLKTTNKRAKFETLKPLYIYIYLKHRHVKGFSSKQIALKVDVTGAENILFAGASVHLSARKFYRLGQWRG